MGQLRSAEQIAGRSGRPGWQQPVGTIVIMVIAGGIGAVVALSSAYRHHKLWPVWAALAIALCASAGGVWSYGLAGWRELAGRWPVRAVEAVRPTVGVVAVSLFWVVIGGLASSTGRPGGAWRGMVLVTVAVLGGAATSATMFGIRIAARGLSSGSSATGSARSAAGPANPAPAPDLPLTLRDALDLIRLRRLLHRMATALGSLVVLATLALAVSTLMIEDSVPEETLVLGASGSLLVGICYAPAAAAIRAAGDQLVEAVFRSAAVQRPGELVEHLDQRARLEQLIGLDRNLLAELQAAIPVLGPLLASASLLLPG